MKACENSSKLVNQIVDDKKENVKTAQLQITIKRKRLYNGRTML